MSDPFDPRRFLTLAESLAQTDDEAQLRTAVGRAYYAVFLMARDRVGVPDTLEAPHSAVRRALRQRGYFLVSNLLQELFDLRVAADYQLIPHLPSDEDWSDNWDKAKELADDLLLHVSGIRTGRLPRRF
jgi:uncharacterized protein (UPF0332 family)